jgi:hypothetical protein
VPLVARHGYTSVSAAWLPGAQRWILVYGTANPVDQGGPVDGPVMARLGHTPFELAHVPDVDIFNPAREHAYGSYMHQPGLDRIHPEVPPAQPPGHNDPGWAYGAHLLNRFIEWDPRGLIQLYYLMSTASPYQVHLMHTTLRSDRRSTRWYRRCPPRRLKAPCNRRCRQPARCVPGEPDNRTTCNQRAAATNGRFAADPGALRRTRTVAQLR